MQNESNELQSQVAQLQQEIAALKRRQSVALQSQRWVVGSLIMIAAIGFVADRSTTQAAPAKEPGDVTCKLLQIVGDDGKLKASITSDDDGGSVAIFDKNEKLKASITNDGSDGSVSVFGKDGGLRIGIGADENGGMFFVQNKQGKPAVGLFCDPTGAGSIALMDKNGEAKKRLP
jgi:hypothetical protein